MEVNLPPVKANILGQMIPWQKELMDQYIRIDALPQYPVEDLETKHNQQLLKEFINNFLEETSEAFGELEQIIHYVTTNQVSFAREHLKLFNIEIADAWHFLLEFLVFAGYEDDELGLLIEDRFRNNALTYIEGQPFTSLMHTAGFVNRQLQRGLYWGAPFRVVEDNDAYCNPHFMGARRISSDLMDDHEKLLWHNTHAWQKVKNQLKNRVWTQTERKVNISAFEDMLFEAITVWATYMDFCGFNQMSIVHNYYTKNQENLQRIKDGY
jgi:hypothetical protein